MQYKKLDARGKRYRVQHYNSWACRLSDVYGSYSYAKENAMDYCEALRDKFNGESGRIISYNKNVFIYGFYFDKDEHRYFAVISPSSDIAYQIW